MTIKMNNEAWFSITRPYEARQIIKIMRKFIGSPLKQLVITDATSCVGGDLVNFSNKFKFVNGVEINPANFALLLHNTQRLNNINLILADYTNVYNLLKQDVVYIDPPWGGKEYKTKKYINLRVGSYYLRDLITVLRRVCSYIFCKVPLNANLQGIVGGCVVVYNKYGRPSFLLVCIKT